MLRQSWFNCKCLETKLLKTGKAYSLGRKEQAININWKRVSRKHVLFTVGEFTLDDAVRAFLCASIKRLRLISQTDPSTRPKLELTNTNEKGRPLSIRRGEATLAVNGGSTTEVLDGDKIMVASHIEIECVLPAVR